MLPRSGDSGIAYPGFAREGNGIHWGGYLADPAGSAGGLFHRIFSRGTERREKKPHGPGRALAGNIGVGVCGDMIKMTHSP